MKEKNTQNFGFGGYGRGEFRGGREDFRGGREDFRGGFGPGGFERGRGGNRGYFGGRGGEHLFQKLRYFKEAMKNGGFGHGFGHGFGKHFNPEDFRGLRHFFARAFNQGAPTNIEETTESFILTLFYPGQSKEAFKVNVKDDMLTIHYSAPQTEDKRQYIFQEQVQESFDRSFPLNGKVLIDQIQASYDNGILTLVLPKNPETNQPAQNVNVQ